MTGRRGRPCTLTTAANNAIGLSPPSVFGMKARFATKLGQSAACSTTMTRSINASMPRSPIKLNSLGLIESKLEPEAALKVPMTLRMAETEGRSGRGPRSSGQSRWTRPSTSADWQPPLRTSQYLIYSSTSERRLSCNGKACPGRAFQQVACLVTAWMLPEPATEEWATQLL